MFVDNETVGMVGEALKLKLALSCGIRFGDTAVDSDESCRRYRAHRCRPLVVGCAKVARPHASVCFLLLLKFRQAHEVINNKDQTILIGQVKVESFRSSKAVRVILLLPLG
jgi:hypothetical protein